MTAPNPGHLAVLEYLSREGPSRFPSRADPWFVADRWRECHENGWAKLAGGALTVSVITDAGQAVLRAHSSPRG